MQAPKIGHTTKHPGGTPVPQLHPTLHVTFQNHHLRYDHNHHRLHEDRQPVNIPLHHNGSHREKKNKLPLQPDAALTAIISLHILAGLNNKTRQNTHQGTMHRMSDGDNNMTAHGLICARRRPMKASFLISRRTLEEQTSCICTAILLQWVSKPKRHLSRHNLSHAETTADSVQSLSSDRLTAEHKLSASCADLACSDTKKICVCL